jgi:hypothetical protein
MKAYKLEILVIDHDELGPEEIKDVIENIKYPNWCISPSVKSIIAREIGEWHDNHPLNLFSTMDGEYTRLFERPSPCSACGFVEGE